LSIFKRKIFAEYIVPHAREDSGRRDTTENEKSFTIKKNTVNVIKSSRFGQWADHVV